ncbi:MAG: hypothetical protein M0Z61_07835 [Nitrospiraceae bacterium]|nr:hypothetical protein [Nitrospiraceae bacterium]
MKNGSYEWLAAHYLATVAFSAFCLTVLPFEKHPRLVDRTWKKVLWALSCLLFIPYLAYMTTVPSFLADEAKRFLSLVKEEETGGNR